ncbi:MAG: hypothetical protein V7608_2594 [Hyphomicrobiales bacterium]|jgi:hypothetical protein
MPGFRVLAAVAAMTVMTTGACFSQTSTSSQQSTQANSVDAKRVRIVYENLTETQVFSPSVFFSHNSSAPPLFKEGQPASFGLMRIAEEGNAGPLLSAEIVKKIGGPFGTAVQGISTPPGAKRSIDIEVTRNHPMVSGAWMLVMTNDGFTGVNAFNAYELTQPRVLDLMAYDAGTEKNNEKKSHLIAMMGTDRDPENGVVALHQGIRGDADAPASWKFDASKPVARITISPIMASEATSLK